MILGGVFERHPNLKLAMTEQPGVWIPYMLSEMDSAVLGARTLGVQLAKKPSEYFRANVFVGASFISAVRSRGHDRGRLVAEPVLGP